MDVTQFRATVADGIPPEGISLALQTLWWDAKGDWNRAHQCAQQDEGKTGSIVHAYLHRKEGDMRNAGGWVQPRRPRTRHGVRLRRSGNRWPAGDADAGRDRRRAGGDGRLHGGVQCQGRRGDPHTLVPLPPCPLP